LENYSPAEKEVLKALANYGSVEEVAAKTLFSAILEGSSPDEPTYLFR
jgi:hypothetical protein